jgi:hypothetical protein
MIQNTVKSPIFITGIERSGSTIIAKIIKHCGAFTGTSTEMLENIEVKGLMDKYYELLGADTRGQYPLPDTKKLIIPTNWKSKTEECLQEWKGEPWMLKGSRLCQIWPVWHYAFPNAKWIIVRRRTPDIVESCLKTGYMKAYKDKEGWTGWVHEHIKLFNEMIEAGIVCKEVWPERMAMGDYNQIKEVVEWSGLTWDNDVIDMVTPLMWNSLQRIGRT